MNKTKKTIALALIIIALTNLTAITALAAENETITVSLRIEGLDGPLCYEKTIKLQNGATVADLMETVNSMENQPEIKLTAGAYGSYVSEIAGLTEFGHGDMSGWSYRVNGASPTYGIDLYKLEDKDEVVYFYGDPFGVGMQYPAADISGIQSDGKIKFTSIDAEYDEDWNEIIAENPVAGAVVTYDGKKYTTDENGEIKLADLTGATGYHELQIERYDGETGVPTVLRFAPDFKIYVPDVPGAETKESDAVSALITIIYYLFLICSK